jgi:SAM-dependent methyltransferase
MAAAYREHFARELEHKPFDRIFLDRVAALIDRSEWLIDLGSGPGQIGAYLAARGARVLSVDLSLAMLREAAALVPGGNRVQADMRVLPFAPSSVGGVVAFYSLIHIPPDELVATLHELHRVLRIGGHVALTTHVTSPPGRGAVPREGGSLGLHIEEMLSTPVDLDFYFYGVAELAPSLEETGFSLVESAEREPYAPEIEAQSKRAYVLAEKRAQPAARPSSPN